MTENFYPRPPRGGRHESATVTFKAKEFLSTPSARRATGSFFASSRHFNISIHALREEGDVCFLIRVRHQLIISIHALREEGDLLSMTSA